LLDSKWGILANGQSKTGHFIYAKLNVPFEANAKVKWGILSNSPFFAVEEHRRSPRDDVIVRRRICSFSEPVSFSVS
jgi:hypothetical protein